MKDMQSTIGLIKQVPRDACSRTAFPCLLGHEMKDGPSSCHFVGVLDSLFLCCESAGMCVCTCICHGLARDQPQISFLRPCLPCLLRQGL